MINEVISEIMKAESQAESLINDAQTKAEQILAENDELLAKMQAEVKEQSKLLREQIAKESEARAKEEYDAIINQSKQECADLLNEKGASADKTGEYIFGRIVNGNC